MNNETHSQVDLVILDIVDFTWNQKQSIYYVVKYGNSSYRKYEGYWTKIIDGKCAGYGSVGNNYQRHLDKIWNNNFKNKKINKEVNITII